VQHQRQPERLHQLHPAQVQLRPAQLVPAASTTSSSSTMATTTTQSTASCTPVGHDTLLSLNGSAPAAWTLHINIAIQPCLHRQL
ncbi:unnamed protein product, partial [Rotaria magnacalcarata]